MHNKRSDMTPLFTLQRENFEVSREHMQREMSFIGENKALERKRFESCFPAVSHGARTLTPPPCLCFLVFRMSKLISTSLEFYYL